MRILGWCVLAVGSLTYAQDWPRFRGPNGSAGDPNANVPAKWSDESILWRKPLDGDGNSSPVIVGNNLYVTWATGKGGKRTVGCFDRLTGESRWTKSFTMPEWTKKDKHEQNTYATSTPAADATGVVVMFSTPNQLLAICLNTDGSVRWQKDLGAYAAEHGSGASPIIVNDLAIIPNEQNGPSSIIALGMKDGQEKWRAERPSERAAYSTPIVLEQDGKKQIITSSTVGVASIDVSNGSLLWNVDRFDRRVCGSPVLAAGMVIAHSGEGSKGDRMIALKPSSASNQPPVVWEETKSIPYCITPTAVGEYLYSIGDSPGILRCAHVATGSQKWIVRLPGNFFPSPVLAGDNLFVVSTSGQVFVFRANPQKYEPLAENRLADTFRATPAVVGSMMYLRGSKFLWCVGSKPDPNPS